MRLLFFMLISTIIYSHSFGQSNEYLDTKTNAMNFFSSKKYRQSIQQFQKCIYFSEAKRADFYFLAASYAQLVELDSAFLFLHIGANRGLRYESIDFIDTDENLKPLYEDKRWSDISLKIKNNTKNYLEGIISNQELRQELFVRFIDDQKYRKKMRKYKPGSKQRDSLLMLQKEVDLKNQHWLMKKLKQHGWPSISKVGVEGDKEAWTIVQHADNNPKLQEKAFQLMKKLVMIEDINLSNLAYLHDRVLINSGEKQIYGTQFELVFDALKTKPINIDFKPIKNINYVDLRRAYLELGSLQSYEIFIKKRYGIK